VKKEIFDELLTSVKQAGRIKRGKRKPSRVFEFAPADIKAKGGLHLAVVRSTCCGWAVRHRPARGQGLPGHVG